MTAIETFDRDAERERLAKWIETTHFDEEPAGVPALEPEDDDE